ncbi:MAG: 23S rRNA (pseudouridine(1915)-N(3))-methyltransferase RlmH [Methanomicrobiales archaeon]|nr:23S rRNA (pseudouridine(1915)-N(3))-methyltransferase RlmH [Methanomicrobiales archaeon]
MQLLILAVGKIRERYLNVGIEEYLVRLRPYASVKVIEVKDHTARGTASAEMTAIQEAEGRELLRALPSDCQVVALDPEGERWTSSQFAGKLKQWEITGPHTVAFLIGGELGLSDEVRDRCAHRLSLSPMTFTHQLARLILLEQLYRGFRIIRGEPYHR